MTQDITATAPADPWAPATRAPRDAEQLRRPSESFARRAVTGFLRRPSAVTGVVVVVIMALFALIGPALSPYSYDEQNLDHVNLSPVMQATDVDGRLFVATQSLTLVELDSGGHLVGTIGGGVDDPVAKRMTFDIGGGEELTINYRVKPPTLMQDGKTITNSTTMWNTDHVLGTDGLGRDMLTRLMFGLRISLLIALIAMAVNLVIGVIYGGISGYIGGNVDAVMMRIVDIVSTIPLILYVVLIQVLMAGSSGFLSIVIALSTVYWVDMARVVRSQVLTIRQREFVAAAKTMGTSDARILGQHIIPHVTGSIVVTATMLIPSAIFIEAFMSFIGLGVAPPMASLGTMSNDALATLRSSPYQLFIPAGAICILMFAFNFIGDGLRDALDPRQNR